MKIVITILTLGSMCFAAEPNPDPFAPRATVSELVMKRDRDLQTPLPNDTSIGSGVFVRAESFDDDGISFVLTNNTDQPLYFYGTGLTRPWFRIQIPWKRGELRDIDMGRWCGTGRYLPMVLAKHSFRFKVSTKEPNFRVGLDLWSDEAVDEKTRTTVWSAVIKKKDNKSEQATPRKPAD